MGKRDPSKPNAGRRGARWIACRVAVLERDNYTCHVCGHPGAGEADHFPFGRQELRAMGMDPDNPDHSRAAHGSNYPCPTCGRKCNQERDPLGRLPGATPPAQNLCQFAHEPDHWSGCTLRHSQRW